MQCMYASLPSWRVGSLRWWRLVTYGGSNVTCWYVGSLYCVILLFCQVWFCCIPCCVAILRVVIATRLIVG
ncbi:hypothetical protein ASPBRDRAFT_479602 [Aspergillus brasiliensis CBS 101740]|uniref:Uncharacterized protein n=1 Tax=Aspergillus brasiliensis (strain CBS 101740 / IMI 381727 / IBT 21946) TaxID=767769 RepID=A0A1L9UTX4_ASPBC|nr:hypothetical protein ASPBRDRAFT_479602 [Aspergillus brasiliensis CBS 101740]